MTVMRVERVVYGVTDLDECSRFFEDFGLAPIGGDGPCTRFATQTGQVIVVGNPFIGAVGHSA